MDGGRRYWAFLSYSHEDRDWANWLHRALETYAIPKALIGGTGLAGPAPRRLRPIFKDREELAASADLRDRVHAALAGSSALIVICSPAAARSSWVEDEIVRFKALRGEARVFAVIVAGAPGASRRKGREEEECFPAALLFHVNSAGVLTDERADLIAADLRAAGDGRKLAKLKLVAGILGVDLDDLVRRDAHR
nr:toll/interleukin-1 receptor domain-containing protein [Pseudomonadota bacterium]